LSVLISLIFKYRMMPTLYAIAFILVFCHHWFSPPPEMQSFVQEAQQRIVDNDYFELIAKHIFSSTDKPIMFFYGPTGYGKTSTAELIPRLRGLPHKIFHLNAFNMKPADWFNAAESESITYYADYQTVHQSECYAIIDDFHLLPLIKEENFTNDFLKLLNSFYEKRMHRLTVIIIIESTSLKKTNNSSFQVLEDILSRKYDPSGVDNVSKLLHDNLAFVMDSTRFLSNYIVIPFREIDKNNTAAWEQVLETKLNILINRAQTEAYRNGKPFKCPIGISENVTNYIIREAKSVRSINKTYLPLLWNLAMYKCPRDCESHQIAKVDFEKKSWALECKCHSLPLLDRYVKKPIADIWERYLNFQKLLFKVQRDTSTLLKTA